MMEPHCFFFSTCHCMQFASPYSVLTSAVYSAAEVQVIIREPCLSHLHLKQRQAKREQLYEIILLPEEWRPDFLVFFTKMTSSNKFCGEAGSASHPTEKQMPKACVSSPILLPLDSELPLLESESPLGSPNCCSLVFAAVPGFFTRSRGCNTPSPSTHLALNYLIANRFQHLFTPLTCHSETHSPSFGVNTIAASAAPEFVNKLSGETITLPAFRNKFWSWH